MDMMLVMRLGLNNIIAQTAPNRIVCANRLFGGLGYVRLGRLKAPTPHSTTFFAPVKMLRIFPYRAQKTSHTTGNVMCKLFPDDIYIKALDKKQ